MRDFSNRLRRIVTSLIVVVAALFAGSCTMTVDNTLGSNMMPENQVMVMRHLKFKGNSVIKFNAATEKNDTIDLSLEGKNLLETRLYRTDSLLASNTGKGYMGVRFSDTLGMRWAGFASTMLYMNAIDEKNGFGYMPIFDTMKLVLSVASYGGDTLVPIRYKVYKLERSLADAEVGVLKHDDTRNADSVAYINCDLSALYDKDKPVFEFTFPQSKLGEGPSTLMIPMDRTPYSMAFAHELMMIPEDHTNPEWDGYGRENIEIYTDDEKWSKRFFGLYIEPDLTNLPKASQGAMYALNLSASGIMLQGRSRNPKDPSMIKDTVGMYYYFLDSDSKFNASVNKIEHDYTRGLSSDKTNLLKIENLDSEKPREERQMVSTCYVEGMGGPATEIYFTDDFLEELVKLETTESDTYSKMGINQCLLSIYVVGANYDWNITQSDPTLLVESLNKAFVRLGAYVNYNSLSPIVDYDYVYENTNGTEGIYGGHLDRSRGCYILNITAHIQKLYNSLRSEDGSYNIENVDDNLRTIYIGAEATSPYSINESVLQGMEDKGSDNAAPIQIDLTYTLIK